MSGKLNYHIKGINGANEGIIVTPLAAVVSILIEIKNIIDTSSQKKYINIKNRAITPHRVYFTYPWE